MVINKEARELTLLPILKFQGPYAICLCLSTFLGLLGLSFVCPEFSVERGNAWEEWGYFILAKTRNLFYGFFYTDRDFQYNM